MGQHVSRKQMHKNYWTILSHAQKGNAKQTKATVRMLALRDLFYLLVFVLGRDDADNDWIYERCREVEASPNGYLDVWARGHYKTTIITYALTIQDIIKNPSITIGIFSHTRPIAKAFLRRIKYEFETNNKLKELFPDILFENPEKDSPKWNEDEGITIRRPNPAPVEATVEASGLVDGQPTGKHYNVLIFDDVVTEKSVTTPEMIEKTTRGWELALNLTSKDYVSRYVGTYYHFADTYHTIIERKAAILRKYPATEDGTLAGKPILLTHEELAEKRKQMGNYTFACQLLLNPALGTDREFKEDDLRYWPAADFRNLNVYILCDPANEKKKTSDFTCFMVVGLGADRNYYVIDMIRDRLSLRERTNVLFKLHQEYRPIRVGIEKYGKDADIQHYEERMQRENYRFQIVALGGTTKKEDRIRKLSPVIEEQRLYLPSKCIKMNYEGVNQDLTKTFITEEYLNFPYSEHDDMFDCMARILDPDMKVIFPNNITTVNTPAYMHDLEQQLRDVVGNSAGY